MPDPGWGNFMGFGAGAGAGRSTVKIDMTQLNRIMNDFDYNVEQVITGLAFELESETKQNIEAVGAIDTGALRASVFTRTKNMDRPVQQMSEIANKRPEADIVELTRPDGNVIASVGPVVEYGVYVEFGHHNVPGRPFLSPAVEKISRDFKSGETYKRIFDRRLPEAKP